MTIRPNGCTRTTLRIPSEHRQASGPHRVLPRLHSVNPAYSPLTPLRRITS